MLYQLISGRSGFGSFFLAFLYLIFSVLWSNTFENSTYLFDNSLLHIALQQLVVVACSLMANHLLLQHKLVSIGDYTLFFMLLISLSAIQNGIENLRVLTGLFFTILLIGRVKSVFNQQNATIVEFDIGIFSAMAYVAHPIFVFVLPYALISILITKANDWRDYLAVITGFGFVIFLKASYYVFVDRITDIPQLLALSFRLKPFEFITYFETAVVILTLIFALFVLNNNVKISDKMNVKERVYYKLWLLLFVFMLLPFFLIDNNLSLLYVAFFLLFPLLVLVQPYILKKKKAIINDLILFLLLCFCISAKLLS